MGASTVHCQRLLEKALEGAGYSVIDTHDSFVQSYNILALRSNVGVPVYIRNPLDGFPIISNGVIGNLKREVKLGNFVVFILNHEGHWFRIIENLGDVDVVLSTGIYDLKNAYKKLQSMDEAIDLIKEKFHGRNQER